MRCKIQARLLSPRAGRREAICASTPGADISARLSPKLLINIDNMRTGAPRAVSQNHRVAEGGCIVAAKLYGRSGKGRRFLKIQRGAVEKHFSCVVIAR